MNLNDFERFCFYDVAANSGHSVVAASFTGFLSSIAENHINGLLMVRVNGNWRAHPDIPGWEPLSPPARNAAVNNSGSVLCFDLGSNFRCGPPTDPASATDCGPGKMPQFGRFNGELVVASYRSDKFHLARLSDCSTVIFSTSEHDPGNVRSMSWNEFGSKLVYILEDGAEHAIYEYDFNAQTHRQIIRDSRTKSSISIERN